MSEHILYIFRTQTLKGTPYIGRVFIDDVYSGGSAKDGKYPLLSEAISGGLFHPRCKDSTSTYYEGITTLKPVTPEEMAEKDRREKLEQQHSYYQNQAKKNQRIADYSLAEDNKRIYQHRTNESLKKADEIVAKSVESGIIKSIDIDDYELVTYGKGISDEVNNCIFETMERCEESGGFIISDIYAGSIVETGNGTPVLQVEPLPNGLLKLNLNTDVLANKTLDEVDSMFAKSKNTVVNSLEEAIVHESGHAKSIFGKNINEIEEFYKELSDIHIKGISKIAYCDGAECLAELEVLQSRGTKVSDEAMEFYKKYMGRKY